jgi:hypothetical protein
MHPQPLLDLRFSLWWLWRVEEYYHIECYAK